MLAGETKDLRPSAEYCAWLQLRVGGYPGGAGVALFAGAICLAPSSSCRACADGVQLIRCTSDAGRKVSRLQACFDMRQSFVVLRACRSVQPASATEHQPHRPTSCLGGIAFHSVMQRQSLRYLAAGAMWWQAPCCVASRLAWMHAGLKSLSWAR